MLYALQIITPPTEEPVDITEAKVWLKIEPTQTEDDGLIEDLIKTIRTRMEAEYNVAMLQQTLKVFYDSFSCAAPLDSRTIELPREPLISVTHVKYYDEAGAQQTLSSNDYTVDAASRPGRIVLNDDKSWPATKFKPNAIEVQFVAGFGDGGQEVDAQLRNELRIILAHLYEHRDIVTTGTIVEETLRDFIVGRWPERRIHV